MTTTHPCAATGCQHLVANHLLMCITHWRQVPAPLREAVYAAYRDLRRARTLTSLQRYNAATADAIAAVAAKQEKTLAAHTQAGGDLFSKDSIATSITTQANGNHSPLTPPGRAPGPTRPTDPAGPGGGGG